MDPKEAFIKSFGAMDDKTFKKLYNISTYRTLKKHEKTVKEGEVSPPKAFMLISGVMRAYLSSENGKQYNKKIYTPYTFAGALTAYLTKTPSILTYEALTECKGYEIDTSKFKALCKGNLIISNLYNQVLERFFMEYERRNLELLSMDATERYLKLRERIPNIDDLIPQFQIASYLSITPVQLSRIRKKMHL